MNNAALQRLVPWLALGVALATSAGSLYLSLGMKLQACPLCFYQRAFALAALAVLAVGLIAQLAPTASISAMALPLANAGLAVAGFHVSLEANGTLECPLGVFGLGTVPTQSLAAFALLTALLLLDAFGAAARQQVASAGAIALGLLLALACCTSNPPLPPAPTKEHAGPPIVCRRPYVAPE